MNAIGRDIYQLKDTFPGYIARAVTMTPMELGASNGKILNGSKECRLDLVKKFENWEIESK